MVARGYYLLNVLVILLSKLFAHICWNTQITWRLLASLGRCFLTKFLRLTEEELGTSTLVVCKSLSTVRSFISSSPVSGVYVHIYLKFLNLDITTSTYEFLEPTSKQS